MQRVVSSALNKSKKTAQKKQPLKIVSVSTDRSVWREFESERSRRFDFHARFWFLSVLTEIFLSSKVVHETKKHEKRREGFHFAGVLW